MRTVSENLVGGFFCFLFAINLRGVMVLASRNESIQTFFSGFSRQIAFVGGKAGGSSQYAESNGYHCAFQAQVPWGQAKEPSQCYFPWASATNSLDIVFYQFWESVRFFKLSFSTRSDGNFENQRPSKFDIIASNDLDCTSKSNWVTKSEVRDVIWKSVNQEKSWHFDGDDVGYRCWGIRCFAHCSIQNLKLETYRE
jgi:hypothetical protein